MNASRSEVVSAGAQRGYLVLVQDLDGYNAIAKKHLHSPLFDAHVSQNVATREARGNPYSPNDFRRWTLTGMLCAQYGFDSADGQKYKYREHWKKPMEGPEHQTATTLYMARANKQALDIKDDLLAAYPIEPDLEPGVWGTQLFIEKGVVRPWAVLKNMKPSIVRRVAEGRLQSRLAVSMPDRELITNLAGIPFTHEDAEQMPQEEFLRDVLPAVNMVVNRIMSPQVVFAA